MFLKIVSKLLIHNIPYESEVNHFTYLGKTTSSSPLSNIFVRKDRLQYSFIDIRIWEKEDDFGKTFFKGKGLCPVEVPTGHKLHPFLNSIFILWHF